MTNNILPEYVSGIPTAKNKSRERMDLIRSYYANLWKKLQREGKSNKIFNDYLGVEVYIAENESDKKTINTASKNWQSTYAVRHLYHVVTHAIGDENQPIYVNIKTGTQSYNGYKNMAILYYDFINDKHAYLNFKVKLTIGIKANNKHVQYCVNKIEVKEKSRPYKAITHKREPHTEPTFDKSQLYQASTPRRGPHTELTFQAAKIQKNLKPNAFFNNFFKKIRCATGAPYLLSHQIIN